jgi:putative ABC transport system substrate-binding protein
MNRRALLALIFGAVLAIPLPSVAQQVAKVPVVGVLLPNLLDQAFPAFREKMRELGYEDGRNVRLMIRSADGKLERLPELAAELVRMNVDVIVSSGTPATRDASNATKAIPIVMYVGDPIATGFVSNLARPDRNLTGASSVTTELAAKRLQLLKELVPGARRIAVLFNANDPLTAPQIAETERAAPEIGVEVRFFPVQAEDSLSAGFTELTGWHADGVLWLPGQGTPFMRATIGLAAERRLPTMLPQRQDVEVGGLISYAPDFSEKYRRVAVFVDKILKGARPGDLPVEQPTKFELVINLKTAKALGLTVPQTLLARADQVIE